MAAHLIHISMEQLADFLFGSNEPKVAKNVLAKLFIQPQNRFSHQFANMAEVNGKTVGILLSYPGRIMKHLEIPMGRQMVTICGVAGFMRFFRKSLPLMFSSEAESDEYFVNTVAVLPKPRSITADWSVFQPHQHAHAAHLHPIDQHQQVERRIRMGVGHTIACRMRII